MKKSHSLAASLIVATALMGGCAAPDYQSGGTQSYPSSSTQSNATSYGVVDSIQMTNSTSGNGGIGVGAVVGGVVGGLLGNQVGGGNGKTVATAAGVVGGAVVGNQIEQRNKTQTTMYQVGVRLDNGTYQTVTQDSTADLRVGNRVRIENGRAYRY